MHRIIITVLHDQAGYWKKESLTFPHLFILRSSPLDSKATWTTISEDHFGLGRIATAIKESMAMFQKPIIVYQALGLGNLKPYSPFLPISVPHP